jgi:carboxyl-terminal processing protease
MPRRNVYLLLLVATVCVACWIQSDRYGCLLTYAMRQIDQRHLEAIDREELFEGAMQGMAERLKEKYGDDYSGYVSPSEARGFNAELDSQFGGLGVLVTIPEKTGKLTVVSPLVGSPACEAGILAGDVILKINGRSADGMSVQDATNLIHGEVGTPVTLSILHEGEIKPVDITVLRAVIKVPTVLGDTCNADGSWNFFLAGQDRIGYVRISAIAERTDEELREALDWLVKHEVRGLILDLRFNCGGYLEKAVTICDMFIDDGKIVSTKSRTGNVVRVFTATPEESYGDFPVAVLINGDSASAAEIIAACLQDHHRAVVVGERSFGKGVVQELLPLDTQQGARRGLMKVTASSYWRPSERNINRAKGVGPEVDWGVRPDPGFEVPLKDGELKRFILSRHQRDLEQMAAANHGKTNQPQVKSTPKPKAGEPLFDPQLDAAVKCVREQIAEQQGDR